MSTTPTSLFDLLPAFYRLRDAQIAQSQTLLTPAESAQLATLLANPSPTADDQQTIALLQAKAARGPLQSLLMVIDEQLAILADNMQQLYDDQFIETCAPWVIPYIGDLIGYQAVKGIAAAVASPRAEVANTISFRRRKGTLLVMEQLARDVTGWGAHAVEFFELLSTTQYMNHLRPQSLQSPNLRSSQPRDLVNTGFDPAAHTLDVRRATTGLGKYNIRNIGIFLWPIASFGITQTPLTAGSTGCFRFSSLGNDIPLYNNPIAQPSDITAAATPANVPQPLTRHQLCAQLTAARQSPPPTTPPPAYYGTGLSLALFENPTTPISIANILCANLSGPEGAWINLPTAPNTIAIDPELGRLALSPGTPTPLASYCYGFSAEIGGGEYSRAATFTSTASQIIKYVPSDYADLQSALNALNTDGTGGDGVVEIEDSSVYTLPTLTIQVKAGGHIELRAADRTRPTLLLETPITITGGDNSSLDLNGLLIAFAPSAALPAAPTGMIYLPADNNTLTTLNLTHLTLVPGWSLAPDSTPTPAFAGLPSLLIEAPSVALTLQSCITGPLQIDAGSSAALTDSILDAGDPTLIAFTASPAPITAQLLPGGALSLSGVTVVGKIYASLLPLVSNSIILAARTPADLTTWAAALWSVRRQQGCVRFSFLPNDFIGPNPYQSLLAGPNLPSPQFASLRYGDPAYMRLVPSTDPAIRAGADDGGEMGAFHLLLAPLRESDLRTRLAEYMPAALEFGVFYQN